ncbi:hypothetical protein A2334_01215 [Candidatus Roizmanbacteria bacterium RIFOXYB2_FULL_38_10]|uniref:Dockerin domain-containing protein n=1 Tax=Candidatus Roizmanbacteria bacterium RIFOXYD1_FULL_38_12 TaxID=1802093 RepID=A0A1F7L1R4_9BACT|nr:MAG: hypothetical protein A3K47_04510 [Candidatus Roizmanbacteria bacterium RIFOXYA2_FULL_38_14]OGK64013.1 MAG: hypothetical protein A3K27_04510 [Candidatus Roizmanbacteria bacterium RIFOXYA1_FULL_37_12]OGK65859.1 MAG: hypothetical protein A3K38_04510 [Candidatus Roizmanbacteria bacterium RIFOXYB1_FULL_40_23]OGK68966.1 MAG: hypothetical protein A2334_01215 [Candidatus Roizmanbacteria bacterium RIFOXYB2_FULL_38_10]OGK70264.1 MAG: hypothetical protein A3K21_04515 [Candidatus Roizmanbacteria ba
MFISRTYLPTAVIVLLITVLIGSKQLLFPNPYKDAYVPEDGSVLGTYDYPPACNKSMGDANCDRFVNNLDYVIWKCEFLGNGVCTSPASNKKADFNADNRVTLVDYEIWRATSTNQTVTNTPIPPTVTKTPTVTRIPPTITHSPPFTTITPFASIFPPIDPPPGTGCNCVKTKGTQCLDWVCPVTE